MNTASHLRIRWMLPVFGISMLVAAACGDDDDGGPTDPPQSDTTLTVSLDGGTTFTAATPTLPRRPDGFSSSPRTALTSQWAWGSSSESVPKPAAPAEPRPRAMSVLAR